MFLSAAPSKPGPEEDFWYQPLGGQARTLSGVHVSPATALRLSTVYKCVKVISETLATLPRHVYRQGERRVRVYDHPVVSLLSKRPNRWQTPMQFFMMMEAHKQLRGNAYAEILYGARYEPAELVPLHPDRVRCEVAPNGLPRYRYTTPGGSERILVPGEILHVTGLSMDGYVGLSPVEAEREAIGAAIAARDYGARFWDNDAKPPFWIELGNAKFKDDAARVGFRNQWQAAYGGANRHRPAVLDEGMKLHELQVTNADAQWIEARKYSDVDICGLWRVPPHKVGILDRATWGNIEHQNIEFVTDTILPQLVGWEQIIARDLVMGDDVYVEFLVEQLLRGDTTTRFTAYGKAITDGWLTRNEARRRENLDPLPGLDEPLQPLNMAPAGQASAGRERPVQTSGRAALVMAASAERVARKEVAMVQRAVRSEDPPVALREAFAAGHAEFVATVLAAPPTAAAVYVANTLDRALRLHAEGSLPRVKAQDWIDTQTAALLRLED